MKLNIRSLIHLYKNQIIIVMISIMVNGVLYISEYKNQLKIEELKFQSQANIKFNSFEEDVKKYYDKNEKIANYREMIHIEPNDSLQFQIIDITDHDQVQELLSNKSFTKEKFAKDHLANNLFFSERQIELAERKYLIQAQPAPNAFQVKYNWNLWSLPLIGCCFTLICLIYLNPEKKHKKVISDLELSFQKNLEFAVMHDPLTSLPNRLLLADRLKQTQADNERNKNYGGLLFIDIDHFKQINDTYGHTQGDQLLLKVAIKLQNEVRKIDTVARFGGDEFVIVLHELGSNLEKSELIAQDIAKKLLQSINEEILITNQRHIIHASIGITIFNGFTKSAETIIQEADMAMYQAKGEGRNRIVTFHPIIRYKNDILNTLNYELQIALEDKQFTLLYQPQLNTEMKVIGVEALLRWNHPKKGIIMPDDFLKMAEQGEYIYLLGDYITEMAISQLARWQNNDSTKHLTMSINVSPRQLEKESFVKNLSELILKYKVNPSLVILEITENALTRDVKNLIQKFYQLRDFGFLLSIDDFGTGYSSLELLFKLPIHQLKIDRTFIMNISEDTQLQIITKTIIGLAKNLNLIVVMEGVETKSQEKWCIDHGCNVLQGFLYAPAISYSEF